MTKPVAWNDRGSLGLIPSEPLGFVVRRLVVGLWGGNDEHDSSGFDIGEHFWESEVLGRENHGELF